MAPSCARGLTRAMKNARFLKETAPDLFAKDEASPGFGTGVPLGVLRKLHRLSPDSSMLGDHPALASFLQANPLPAPARTLRGPAREALFSGIVYFAQVTFNTSAGAKVVSNADMGMIVAYAQRASVPISEYAVQQYGANRVTVSSTILNYSVDVPTASFTDGDLQGWVNDMATKNSLAVDSCIFVVVPEGVSAADVGGNSGYHQLANIPYIVAGVFATGLTLQDQDDVYAMVVSHELAEMVVDPKADLVNPEVCDPCDVNCGNLTRVYFDTADNFLGANQSTPPGGFTFDYYICGIVKSDGAANCPAAAADCQYEPVTRSLEFVMGQSTFSKDEASLTLQFAPAFWLRVGGLTSKGLGINSIADLNNTPNPAPNFSSGVDLGLNSGNNLTSAQLATISTNLPAINFGPAPIIPSDPSMQQNPQTFLYPYTLTFSSTAAFDALQPGQAVFVTLSASLKVGSVVLTASANVVLVAGANPRFEDIDPSHPGAYPSWLSFDLRFFKVSVPSSGLTQTVDRFGATMSRSPADAPEFIANAIRNFTTGGGSAGSETFDSLAQGEAESALEYLQRDNSGNLVFNFAIARVRLRGNTPGAKAKKVRVFFRLFNAQTTASDFNTMTTYRFSSGGQVNGKAVPLLGVQDGEYVTIPCFASPRVNFNATTNTYVPVNMNLQPEDGPNVQSIDVIPGVEVDTFFGCWIDNNQPDQKWLPPTVTAGNPDGPFAGSLLSVNEAIAIAPHQCMIAEIRDDDTPIPAGANSANSDKLAQRNIAWIDGPNPGAEDSRRMPHPFDIRASPREAQVPDELMVFWGNTPAGSSASFYLPAVDAAEILKIADATYPTHQLISVDWHTIKCPTGGVTFIPLPNGTARNAGLLTVDLPPGLKRGHRYDIAIRQTSPDSAFIPPPPSRPPVGIQITALPTGRFSWRQTLGAFQFSIVISTKEQLLLRESRLLAWLRHKLSILSPTSRWLPVAQRYTDQIAGRVSGFGGDPGAIRPSPTGDVPGCEGTHPYPGCGDCGKHSQFTGKVEGITHNRFGDVEGFVLYTREGERKKFRINENAAKDLLVYAMVGRRLITICTDAHHHDWPVSFILH